jgi:hypothetical protein
VGARVVIGMAVLAALALHGIIIWLFAGAAPSPEDSSRSEQGRLSVTIVDVPRAVQGVADAPAPSPPEAKQGLDANPAVARTEEPSKNRESFLSPDQVDVRARPRGDWAVEADHLMPNSRFSVKFAVWVSAEGRIVRWKVIEQEPQGPWASQLLAPIESTPMDPAMLNGRKVPSVGVHELGIQTP